MAKLSSGDIGAADIEAYIATESDFAFELAVLNRLTALGLNCRHAGTYDDPVTRKAREFDIQAETTTRPSTGRGMVVRFAVECKNIRANYPLVVHRVPRVAHESYLDVVWSTQNLSEPISLRQYGERIRFQGPRTPYTVGQPVAKSADQVGRRIDGEIQTADYEVFDRITQAINASYELLRISHYAGQDDQLGVASVVLPVLIVPSGRLWGIDYDQAGAVTDAPKLLRRVSYFVGRDWLVGRPPMESAWYSLSHLEICTFDELENFVDRIVNHDHLNLRTVLDVIGENLDTGGRS